MAKRSREERERAAVERTTTLLRSIKEMFVKYPNEWFSYERVRITLNAYHPQYNVTFSDAAYLMGLFAGSNEMVFDILINQETREYEVRFTGEIRE